MEKYIEYVKSYICIFPLKYYNFSLYLFIYYSFSLYFLLL